MKVCFLTSNHLPEARGGTEQVVHALEMAFGDEGVEVVAISSSDVPHQGTDVAEETFENVRIHRVFKLADEWDHQGFVRPRILDLVRRLLVEEKPDVVHIHSTASLGTGCAAIATELGIPVVMTFHDLWVTCARYFRLPLGGVTCPTGDDREPCLTCIDSELGVGHEHVAQALAERDDRIRADVALAQICTAPSHTTAQTVRECLPLDRTVEVVPHGLLRPVPLDDRAAGPRAGAPLRVGTFGGLGAEKGLLELVAAVSGLPCELHLAGRHYGREISDAVAELKRGGTTVVNTLEYGPLDPHPARSLDLAVFPSKCQETYGLVVDEALAHGVPCVVSDQGALAERSDQPGVVVSPLANLRTTLHDLVHDPDRLAGLRAAIPGALPSVRDAAARYLDLYRRLQ